MDPTMRMRTAPVKAPDVVDLRNPEEQKQAAAIQDALTPKPSAVIETVEAARELPPGEPGEVQPNEILTDVDFEKFYLEGTVEYTFFLNKSFPVVLRLLTANELLEVNEFLWASTKEDKSVNVVMLEYAIKLLSRCAVKYGDKKLYELPIEGREKFFNGISGMIVNVLSRKYTILEESVTRYFASAENVKN